MARMPRIKIVGHIAGYHIVTRVRGRQFLLDEGMKAFFVRTMRRLKKLYYVEYGAFTVLDNHYHLLLRFADAEDIDADSAMARWNTYHADTEFVRNPGSEESRQYVINELIDVSSFMKRFNWHLTTKYNYEKEDTGTLWERRFRSSIIERGWAFINCAAYIELNAFRASLVRQPEEYSFCSLNWLRRGNPDGLIAPALLAEGLQLTDNPGLGRLTGIYTAFVYESGVSPHRDRTNGLVVTEAMQKKLKQHDLKPAGGLGTRTAEFICGKVSAGLELVRDIYETHIDPGLHGRQARTHAAKWIHGIGDRLWTLSSGLGREADP